MSEIQRVDDATDKISQEHHACIVGDTSNMSSKQLDIKCHTEAYESMKKLVDQEAKTLKNQLGPNGREALAKEEIDFQHDINHLINMAFKSTDSRLVNKTSALESHASQLAQIIDNKKEK